MANAWCQLSGAEQDTHRTVDFHQPSTIASLAVPHLSLCHLCFRQTPYLLCSFLCGSSDAGTPARVQHGHCRSRGGSCGDCQPERSSVCGWPSDVCSRRAAPFRCRAQLRGRLADQLPRRVLPRPTHMLVLRSVCHSHSTRKGAHTQCSVQVAADTAMCVFAFCQLSAVPAGESAAGAEAHSQPAADRVHLLHGGICTNLRRLLLGQIGDERVQRNRQPG